jgi:hypothetical protein
MEKKPLTKHPETRGGINEKTFPIKSYRPQTNPKHFWVVIQMFFGSTWVLLQMVNVFNNFCEFLVWNILV